VLTQAQAIVEGLAEKEPSTSVCGNDPWRGSERYDEIIVVYVAAGCLHDVLLQVDAGNDGDANMIVFARPQAVEPCRDALRGEASRKDVGQKRLELEVRVAVDEVHFPLFRWQAAREEMLRDVYAAESPAKNHDFRRSHVPQFLATRSECPHVHPRSRACIKLNRLSGK
jgi:hypothetical protein